MNTFAMTEFYMSPRLDCRGPQSLIEQQWFWVCPWGYSWEKYTFESESEERQTSYPQLHVLAPFTEGEPTPFHVLNHKHDSSWLSELQTPELIPPPQSSPPC